MLLTDFFNPLIVVLTVSGSLPCTLSKSSRKKWPLFRAHWPLKWWGTGGVSKGGCPPFGAGFEGAQPLATFRGQKDGLGHILRARGSPGHANKQFRTAPDASGEWAGQECVGRGRKTGSVSKSLATASPWQQWHSEHCSTGG